MQSSQPKTVYKKNNNFSSKTGKNVISLGHFKLTMTTNNSFISGVYALSYLFKNLNTMITKVRYNYSTIIKDCCRDWLVKLPCLTATCSKLCNKLSTQFKHLDSAIPGITDEQVACFVHRQATSAIELPIPTLLFPKSIQELSLPVKNLNTMITTV